MYGEHKQNMRKFQENMRMTNRNMVTVYFVAPLLCGMVAFSSCATKAAFATSTVVPAAEGQVKIKKDGNDNYKIELHVEHLADPKRLQPSKEYYVVWAQTEHDVVKNLGQLKSSTGWFSDTRKASLETVSPFKPEVVFITAEDQVDIPHPMGIAVPHTNHF